MAESLRRCIATGETGEAALMVRFVVGPDGSVVPDLARKLPGRGMWLTASRQALERALSKRAFSRVARRNVDVDRIRVDRLEAILAARCCEVLGLVRRAGQVVTGFEKVRTMLEAQGVGCLVSATDGAADGKRKLRGLAGDVPWVKVLNSEELSLALGRENVVHAALSRGRLCERFLAETRRLAGFRVSDG